MALVTRTLVHDDLTPVRAYAALRSAIGGPTFLLESAVAGERWGRYSILGVKPRRDVALPIAGDPFAELGPILGDGSEHPASLAAKLARAAVGVFPYDLVHALAPVPRWPSGLLAGRALVDAAVVVFDHLAHTVEIAAHDASDLAEVAAALATSPALASLPVPDPSAVPASLACSTEDAAFEANVRRAKEYIAAGDAFQVVLARTFSAPRDGRDPLDVYRALRVLSPSPYMFLVELPARGDLPPLAVAGASPETLVRLEDRKVTLRPIAGTRRRGRTTEEDVALGEELAADPKERAEHVMLIDLARNDVGRIAETGSVRLPRQMEIERFSHVMHIVSEVEGVARRGVGPVDVLRAAFPAGTLSGAPKVRAMQIIRELEPRPRGVYGGAVGYLGRSGDLDLAIAIRTVVLAGDRLEVTAGAGVVDGSEPRLEALETRNKARAALAAIAAAPRRTPGLRPGGDTRPRGYAVLVSLRSVLLAVVLVAATPSVSAAETESWATARARSLTAEGDAELAAGQLDAAARRYTDAITIDGTFGPAYLALGVARERSGDVREAERVYDVALDRIPGFVEALLARARLRHRVGSFDEASADLDEAIRRRSDDVALVEEAATWDVERQRYPRALARYRRIRAVLEARGDRAALAKTALEIRALAILSAETDVVRARRDEPTRRAIRSIARRLGL